MELETLRSDMIAAMKAKDKARKEAISSLISAAKKVAIDEGCRDDIKPELVDRVILKELKTVKEQIDTCPVSREDLKAEYQFRYDVISEYAPKQMSADEVKAYIQEKFADVLATKNKGAIMKAVMADMKVITTRHTTKIRIYPLQMLYIFIIFELLFYLHISKYSVGVTTGIFEVT